MNKALIALVAVAALGAFDGAAAQNTRDQTELLISQIQTDKRAVVLQAMNLSDAELKKFGPIYDQYQVEMKGIMQRSSDVITKFANSYGSMTDDAAKSIMKDFFKVGTTVTRSSGSTPASSTRYCPRPRCFAGCRSRTS